MRIFCYNPEEHKNIIATWLKDRGMDSGMVADLPEIGYVAYMLHIPIAAGFLRKVEGNFALLDSLITDPVAPANVRDKAIDLVVNDLIGRAKIEKMSKLIAFSVDKNTILRSSKHGFVGLPHSVISLSLKEGE